MKTKTIYHLNHDCDKIVKIEVRQKIKKKKKRPVVVNLERLVGNLNVVIDSKPSLDNPYEPVVAPLNPRFEKLHDLIRETLLKAVQQAKSE